MVAYSFKRQFAGPILEGTKGGTIRAARKYPQKWSTYARNRRPGGHAAVGDNLDLYVAMRTKQCRLITRRICVAVEPIVLDFLAAVIAFPARECLFDQQPELDALARFDGFAGYSEMARFWQETHGDPQFAGWHIRWIPLHSCLAF